MLCLTVSGKQAECSIRLGHMAAAEPVTCVRELAYLGSQLLNAGELDNTSVRSNSGAWFLLSPLSRALSGMKREDGTAILVDTHLEQREGFT